MYNTKNGEPKKIFKLKSILKKKGIGVVDFDDGEPFFEPKEHEPELSEEMKIKCRDKELSKLNTEPEKKK